MSEHKVDVNALVHKYERLVYSVLSKKLPAHVGDDDLVQVGRIALWRCAKKYDPDKGKFTTYAYQSIYHSMLRELGKRKATVSLSTIVDQTEKIELQDTIEDLKQSLDNLDIKFELEEFMKRLNERQRTILKKRAIGKSFEEIAKDMNLTYSKVWREMKVICELWERFDRKIEEECENDG